VSDCRDSCLWRHETLRGGSEKSRSEIHPATARIARRPRSGSHDTTHPAQCDRSSGLRGLSAL
jgi:hypothetical protein